MNESKIIGRTQEEKQQLFQQMIDQLIEFPNPHNRPQIVTQKICEALELISFFNQNIQSLEQQKQILQEYSQYIKLEIFNPNEILFKAGDKGDKQRFYIVLKGSVDIYKPKDNDKISDQLLRKATENVSYNQLFEVNSEKDPKQNTIKEALQASKLEIGADPKKRKTSLFIIPLLNAFHKTDQEEDNEEQLFQALHQKLTTIHYGGSFGELALTYNKPRFATARISKSDKQRMARKRRISCQIDLLSQEKTYLATLDKKSYNKITINLEEQAQLKAASLKQVFPNLEQNTLIRLSYNLIPCHYPKNHYIYREGQESDCFYILQEGEVRLEKKNQIKQISPLEYISPLLKNNKYTKSQSELNLKPIALIGKGAILGLEELCNKSPRNFSSLCISETVFLFKVSQNHFQEIVSEGQGGKYVLNELIKLENEFLNDQYRSQSQKIKKATVRLFKGKTDLNLRALYDEELRSKKLRKNNNIIDIIQGNTLKMQQPSIQAMTQEKIIKMVKRNKNLQSSNSRMADRLTFGRPFFKDLMAENFKMVRKMQMEYFKSRDRESYNQQFSSDHQVDKDRNELQNKQESKQSNCRLFQREMIKTYHGRTQTPYYEYNGIFDLDEGEQLRTKTRPETSCKSEVGNIQQSNLSKFIHKQSPMKLNIPRFQSFVQKPNGINKYYAQTERNGKRSEWNKVFTNIWGQ